MDERIWESLQRLTVVANKLSFQRVDARNTGAQPRTPSPDDPDETPSPAASEPPEIEENPDYETMAQEMFEDERQLITTWNLFQDLCYHRENFDSGYWVFTDARANDTQDYDDIMDGHTPRTPIGQIFFSNGSYYKFMIRVHETHRDKMVVDASGSGGPAGTIIPYTLQQFNYTGTPHEIIAHLNAMIGRPISPTGVEEIIHGFYF